MNLRISHAHQHMLSLLKSSILACLLSNYQNESPAHEALKVRNHVQIYEH